MFKFLPEEAKRYLLGIFNEIISTGRVPESWLRTMVVPILKPRKDLYLLDSYRPISLRACARKLLEKMLCTCLDYWAEKHDVLSLRAYDNVMIDILSDILRERGTSAGREIFVPFIVAEEIGFLYCREYMTLVEVRYSAFSSTISLGRVRISSSHLDVNSFNMLMYMSHRLFNVARGLAQTGGSMGLTISASKLEVMLFTRKHERPPVLVRIGFYVLFQTILILI
jgi:hypothetical protein